MKQGHFLDRGTLWLPLLLLLGLFACFPAHVLATDMPVIGGLNPGGTYLRFECQKGSYLVGLKGKRGDWVDRIAAVCAPWLPAEQTFGRTSVGSFFGTSEGGLTFQRSVGDQASVIGPSNPGHTILSISRQTSSMFWHSSRRIAYRSRLLRRQESWFSDRGHLNTSKCRVPMRGRHRTKPALPAKSPWESMHAQRCLFMPLA
jgi:hypothetical protein